MSRGFHCRPTGPSGVAARVKEASVPAFPRAWKAQTGTCELYEGGGKTLQVTKSPGKMSIGLWRSLRIGRGFRAVSSFEFQVSGFRLGKFKVSYLAASRCSVPIGSGELETNNGPGGFRQGLRFRGQPICGTDKPSITSLPTQMSAFLLRSRFRQLETTSETGPTSASRRQNA